MVTVKVKTDFRDDLRRLSLEGAGLRIGMAARRGMNNLVPLDTGALRAGAYAGDFEVTYSRGEADKYANYVLNGRGTPRTPGTYMNWAEVYERQGAPEVVAEMERIIDGR